MKNFITLAILTAAITAVWAGSSKVTTVAVANIATEPTSATAGLATTDVNNTELRRLIITAKQPDDGGVEVGDLTAISFRAWKYTIQGTLADAGTLFRWSRLPELDLAYVTDGGSPYVTHNNGITLTVAVPPMGNGSRITYTAQSAVAADAGTANVDLVIEGRYLPELAPR